MQAINNRIGGARAWVIITLFALVAAGCDSGSGAGAPTAVILASLSPASANAGSPTIEITATGSGFTTSSIVEWNGAALTTNYVSATSLTATVPESNLANAGVAAVTVSDASIGGPSSAVVNFTINTQTPPTIAALAPSTMTVGGGPFQLVVTGTNFSSSASVLWNGRPLPTTFDSDTQLTAQVSAAQIAATANIAVTVVNDASAGGTSNVGTFTITSLPAVPTLSSVSPNSLPAYSSNVTLTLTGTGFTPTTVVFDGSGLLVSSYVSATQIDVLPVAYTYASGSEVPLSVMDPASGNVRSNTQILTFTAPIPVISSVSPSTVTAAQGPVTITVGGQYLTATSAVYFNGSARPTTLNWLGQLVAQLTALDVETVGTASITVEDSVSGDVASNALSFVIQALPPLVITQLSPATVPAGNAAFTLTVFGNGFSTSSAIAWNGVALSTTHVATGTLQAAVSAAQVASIGSVPITVVNPSNQGGTSAALLLSIVAPSIDAVSYQINTAHTGVISFKSATLPAAASWSVNIGGAPSNALIVAGRVYVMANANGNAELLALDAATGATLWGPIAFSGPAGLTYDEGTLFINSGVYYSIGLLTAVDAVSGTTKWNVTIPGQWATEWPAVAARGIVYVFDTGVLTAFNETSGAQIWLQDVGGTDGSVAVTVDGIYTAVPCAADDFQPLSGVLIWAVTSDCEGGGGATPVAAGSVLYAPVSGLYSGFVYAPETGSLLGAFAAAAPPAVSASSAYFLNGSALQGIALSNNQINWSFVGDGMLVTSPIVVNNYVFIGSSSGNVYALDATTGALLWTQNLGAAIPGPQTGYSALQGATGLAAGDGVLIVPAGNTVTAFVLSTDP